MLVSDNILTVLLLQKQDEYLLEDVWTLLRAGRLEEACHLCRYAGQPWRAATLCVFGGLDQFPSIEVPVKNGKDRTLQAIELKSGIGHQWHLWKWASYCASEPEIFCYFCAKVELNNSMLKRGEACVDQHGLCFRVLLNKLMERRVVIV